MDPRISLITLGVENLDRAVAFYCSLGWERTGDDSLDVAFFRAGHMVFALWGRDQLASDSGLANDGRGFDGIVLAYNTHSPAEVDTVIEEAREAGATISKEPSATFWGGYSGCFVDPDGHAWEVAHNPHWTINDNGSITM